MRNIYLSVLITALLALTLDARGQTEPHQPQLNCTQTLRSARAFYDQGRLHELPTWLDGCLTKSEDNGGFTEAERIEAYKILTLSYIYLEEPAQADKSMTSLLQTDPFFQIDEEVDPVELKNLYRKFRTNPVYRAGIKFGFNTNHINVQSNHYLWGASRGKGKYSSTVGIQITGTFEKDITERLVLNPEVSYFSNSFSYNNPSPLSVEGDPSKKAGDLKHTISQKRIQANFLVQYELKEPKNVADKFIPYVAFGPTLNYLLDSRFTGETNVDEDVTGPSFSTKSHYRPLTVGLTAVGGVKVRIGVFYITGDIRFQYGLMNIVNARNRFQWEGENERLQDYGYVDNDYTVSHSMFNVGIILPRFHPIKLIR